MKKIVAIGGGEIKDLETLVIDREIVRLTGKKQPVALFIPTASGDAEGYWKTFQDVYGGRLKCKTDVLFLTKERLSSSKIRNKIIFADLIYVGGGNTLKMMKVWRRLKVDKFLMESYEKGTVLSGLSAGAICWFDSGFSDSAKFRNIGEWDFMKVKGLGLVKAMFCPHYHKERREKRFQETIKKYGGIGVALDNNTALEVVNGKFRVIGSQERTYAYQVFKRNKEVIVRKIEESNDFKSLSTLLKTEPVI